MTALAKEPAQRFASVQAFATALDAATGVSSGIEKAPARSEDAIVVQEPVISSSDSTFTTETMGTQEGIMPPVEEPQLQKQAPAARSLSSSIIGVDGIVGPQTWHSLGEC